MEEVYAKATPTRIPLTRNREVRTTRFLGTCQTGMDG